MAVLVVHVYYLLHWPPGTLPLNSDLLRHHPLGFLLCCSRIQFSISLVHIPLNHVLYVLLLVGKHFVDFVLLLLLEL